MMASIIQLWLFPAYRPDKSRRAREGDRERKSRRYRRADRAYNALQVLMTRWRRRRMDFTPRYQFLTGCADLRQFLRIHRTAFWGIAHRLGLRSMRSVRCAYGRAGWRTWSWDHLTLHEHDTATDAGLAAATNAKNLRPVIAGENVRRGTAGTNPNQLQLL